jgi:hypothetical protein
MPDAAKKRKLRAVLDLADGGHLYRRGAGGTLPAFFQANAWGA